MTPDVWDVDAQGVPHDLGVLSHYDGDRLVPRRQPPDPGPRGRADRATAARTCPDLSVAERQQYLTMAVRDFLNEGGKLAYAGETAGYYGARRRRSAASTTASTARPSSPASSRSTRSATACCSPTTSPSTTSGRRPHPARRQRHRRHARPAGRQTALFGGPATVDNPIDEAGAFVPHQRRSLPVERVPAVRERGGRRLPRPAGTVHRRSRARGRWPPRTTTTATCASRARST